MQTEPALPAVPFVATPVPVFQAAVPATPALASTVPSEDKAVFVITQTFPPPPEPPPQHSADPTARTPSAPLPPFAEIRPRLEMFLAEIQTIPPPPPPPPEVKVPDVRTVTLIAPPPPPAPPPKPPPDHLAVCQAPFNF